MKKSCDLFLPLGERRTFDRFSETLLLLGSKDNTIYLPWSPLRLFQLLEATGQGWGTSSVLPRHPHIASNIYTSRPTGGRRASPIFPTGHNKEAFSSLLGTRLKNNHLASHKFTTRRDFEYSVSNFFVCSCFTRRTRYLPLWAQIEKSRHKWSYICKKDRDCKSIWLYVGVICLDCSYSYSEKPVLRQNTR